MQVERETERERIHSAFLSRGSYARPPAFVYNFSHSMKLKSSNIFTDFSMFFINCVSFSPARKTFSLSTMNKRRQVNSTERSRNWRELAQNIKYHSERCYRKLNLLSFSLAFARLWAAFCHWVSIIQYCGCLVLRVLFFILINMIADDCFRW